MSQPKLSIITVNLNNAEGLQKTIESVVSQTFTNYEYIIIDGGSTDGSKEIIEKYADKITYWVSEPDKGIYNAMNKGLNYATGEYVYFLNSGDVFASRIILKKIIEYGLVGDIVYGNIIVKNSKNEERLLTMPDNLDEVFLLRKTIPHQATLTKNVLFDKVGRYDEKYKISADYKFSLEAIFLHKYKTQYIPEFISIFDNTGFGTLNKELRDAEKKEIQMKIFSKKNKITLINRFKKKIVDKRNNFFYKLKEPVFIIGTGRCGTSLLTHILSTHSQLKIYPNEANILWHPALYPPENSKFDTLPIEANPKEFTKISIDNWPKNQKNHIKKRFKSYFGRDKAKIPIVKSAMISFMLNEILDIFPNAKFIHIFRYGPSVVESYVKKNFNRYNKWKPSIHEYYNLCAKYWNDTILHIEEFKINFSKNNSNRFFEFSYESLCNNPNNITKQLSDFLKIEQNKFNFDFDKIKSANFKVNIGDEEKWSELFPVMKEALSLKKYI